MKHLSFLILTVLILSCSKDNDLVLEENILADYIELNSDLDSANIIACAGGKPGGLFGIENEPSSVFFYPIEGATDFQYFEAVDIADSLDYSKYIRKELTSEPIFNGYLWKFNNQPFDGQRMGIVTYKSLGKFHTCSPIRLKPSTKPTEVNTNLVSIATNGSNPIFSWEDGLIKENAIYFQVISDESNNFISGTYTYEKEFAFYDLSNVVLNITDSLSTPILESNKNYKFTMMGVSEDNWVNLLIEKEFKTN